MNTEASSGTRAQLQLPSVAPALQHYLAEFQSLYEQRLWHQLTERVQAFFADPAAKGNLLVLFTQFVSLWYKNMNKLIYTKLAIQAAAQIGAADALTLLEGVAAKVKQVEQPEQSALMVLVTMEAAHYRLCGGDLQGARQAIEGCSEAAESLAGVDALIPATFFRVCAEYDKATLAFSSYYKNSLLYLSCVQIEDLPAAEAHERAHDLCVAALLGETTFNFGELLVHPVFALLAGTPLAYLCDTLLAFNVGDHDAFDRALPQLSAHPALGSRIDFLREKICLMAFVEAVFRQLKTSHTLSFPEITKATRVSPEQSEFLIMKALGMGLVRGTIREPERAFVIEWVQPRVLDLGQIAELRAGVQAWRRRVQETSQLVHHLVPDALVAASTI